ncbi:endopeptidase La [Candidatus Dependentiae bacterium]|nr:endopeptidase La [Candidatus Dependentiae bacterium]
MRTSSYVLPVLPLKNVVAWPHSIRPVAVGRDISIQAVEAALRGSREIFVTAQKSVDIEDPTFSDLYTFGTRASIVRIERFPNGVMKILIEGLSRAKVLQQITAEGYMAVEAIDVPCEKKIKEVEEKALWRSLFAYFKEYVELSEKHSAEVFDLFKGVHDLDYLTDTLSSQLTFDLEEQQEVLEIFDVKQRAIRMSEMLKSEIEILKTEKNIKKRVQTQIEKHQRDYYLNEQMRAIQRELGRDDQQKEIDQLREKAASAKMTAEALEKVEIECRRLEQMQFSSPEAAVSRNYIETLIALPWNKASKDRVSLQQAEKILNDSHAGMTKVKERILEFIAAKKFAGDKLKKAPIICLAGPPGVGKTSLAKSIADALGRTFVRISLGGMRDEAEIRGHRRTYIGAMPGKIIQAMRKSKVVNPVILLDEVDKMSMDFRGDPASALLEVLDPEQNKSFSDYFLEIGYDVSQVMFVLTANVVDQIPGPLLDRMDLVSLSGYTEAEKLDIAQKFLVPKLLKEYAVLPRQLEISTETLKRLISDYTKEAGVRSLDRLIAQIVRKSLSKFLEDKAPKKIKVQPSGLEELLGAARFRKDASKSHNGIGVATGLAWTEVGGDVLEIEVTQLKGKGNFTITGQLGEVMQESAQAALSYIRSRAKELGIKPGFYSESDLHIHVPEGAIPKDGPSAGITMVVALVSSLANIPVKSTVAMTGEVTLRGRVLAVGGLKEKLLAATRFGFTTVIVPKENEVDIKEFEKELDSSLTVIYADHMDTVLAHAFDKFAVSFGGEEKVDDTVDEDKKTSKESKKKTVGMKKKTPAKEKKLPKIKTVVRRKRVINAPKRKTIIKKK